jgi:hypothetical protein
MAAAVVASRPRNKFSTTPNCDPEAHRTRPNYRGAWRAGLPAPGLEANVRLRTPTFSTGFLTVDLPFTVRATHGPFAVSVRPHSGITEPAQGRRLAQTTSGLRWRWPERRSVARDEASERRS